ncbi:ADP-ribosylglycohydrolase family protein [Kitasatospora sp. NPDC092039]|uniref:ADP-ribosylglycohydrolase family protein n=1 Tax=Kitasatospora sp. NPDC092039 TaxID=3364086 RepID=UPI0037F3B8C8
MRAAGSVLDSLEGLALGDAFGDRWFSVPLDEAPAALAARLVRPAPWHWTDDTAMALVLVRHLLDTGEVRPDALAQEFAAEYTREYGRKYGPSMHRVLRGIGAGGDWRAITAGQFEGQGSHGNGAAMRVAPLGAWFADDLDAVVRQAELQALTTHFHPEAVAGAPWRAGETRTPPAPSRPAWSPPGRGSRTCRPAGSPRASDSRAGSPRCPGPPPPGDR